MARGEQRQIAVDAVLVVRLRHSRGIEQKVGDLRHGGNHGRDRPLRRLRRDQIAGGSHTGGGAHAGAAEFHNEQMIQLTFPFGGVVGFPVGKPRANELQNGFLHLFGRHAGGIQISRIGRL